MIKSTLGKAFATWTFYQQNKSIQHPIQAQKKILQHLIKKARNTYFGKTHHFKSIKNYQDFKKWVPIRSYENYLPFIEKIKNGIQHVTWPGKPLYFAKTSGTTAGNKYIPITKESIKNHIKCAQNAILYYIYNTGNTQFLNKKMLFLSGSPKLKLINNIILTGRLSGIVHHHIPTYLRSSHFPKYKTNCIADWGKKISQIIQDTKNIDLGVLAGIPPWIQMYFDQLLLNSEKKTIAEILPHLSLIVHGGVNFLPYRKKLIKTLGKNIHFWETYPASEGFIAFQDSLDTEGLLLQINQGIFYEFIPIHELSKKNPQRLSLEEVELKKQYAVVINSNAGLWGYLLGDTVKFITKMPYRILVTGRTKQYISAFGEHVIVEEVEQAIQYALAQQPAASLIEFTVAPAINDAVHQASYHEWFIEFDIIPQNIDQFARDISQQLQYLNNYYHDLMQGKILRELKITLLKKNAFRQYMQSQGKLGGQNKVPHISNNRSIADALLQYSL